VSLAWKSGAPLGTPEQGVLFAAWLNGAQAGAAAETGRALSAPSCARPAPLFAAHDGDPWRAARRRDGLADGWDAGRLAGMAAGACDIVVTGQQPGFLGGPLLTLHKVATAIALARLRNEAGLPTLAVFWCGDDDDDLVEALAPVGWDPALDTLVRAEGRVSARAGNLGRPLVGATASARWCAPGAALLERLATGPRATVLAADLAAMWGCALSENWSWSRLNVAALQRVFTGQPLAIVRGNDPDLHAAAAAFYGAVGPLRERCSELAHGQGRVLAAATGRAPVSDRSLAHHLFVAAGDRRVPLAMTAALPAASQLRPGVMLRSLVQDWLLRPVAVVVGPGERAYLEQIEPLYAELGVPRCALVPRLFGWALPVGLPGERLAALLAGAAAPAAQAAQLADELAVRAAADLRRTLTAELGVADGRAEALAAGRARRWRRGIAALFRDEGRRQWQLAAGAVPACVFPDGQRQERRLALAAAAAVWGDDLASAVIDAACEHLSRGAMGQWREYVVS
jgi:hypothetical protein